MKKNLDLIVGGALKSLLSHIDVNPFVKDVPVSDSS
jgi:hypothetical protein